MKFNRSSEPTRCAYSLIEFMIAVGLSSLVLAAVLSLTLFGTRSSLAIINYSDLDGKNRYALDLFSREIRSATAVIAIQTNYPNCSITLTNADEGATIKLAYDSVACTVTLAKTGPAHHHGSERMQRLELLTIPAHALDHAN